MLILSRKLNEQIRIGDTIILTVLETKGNKVRIGIEAPPEVSIMRAELLEAGAGDQPPRPLRQRRILIVDDNPEDRQLVRRLLGRGASKDYTVTESELGEEGLERCRAEAPDCVLLDYKLPDLDGLQFLGALRQDQAGRSIPVIMVTGEGSEKLAHQAIQKGAQAYLTKDDLSPELLQQLIYQAIRLAHPN
jgi:carbon storage regulator CsrA